jgi:hypothetical protein
MSLKLSSQEGSYEHAREWSAQTVLVGKSERKKLFRRPGLRWENNIKMNF